MSRKSKREIERDIETLTPTDKQEKELQQNIPTDLIEEWAEFSGHDMGWVEDLQ